MMWSPATVGRKLAAVMSLDDPPAKIALGLSVGMFVSCTPFYGLHTLMAVGAAVALRLNKAVTVTGAWLNLPWFAPVVYGVSLKVGELVRRRGEEPGRWSDLIVAMWSPRSWSRVAEQLFAALLVGTTIVGLLAGVVTYVVSLLAIRELRRPRSGREASG